MANVFKLNENLKLKTQTMLKAVMGAPVQFDLNANFLIKEKVWAGLAYRSGSAASAMVGLQISPQFLASYSYDYSINSIQKYSMGSHEIVLNYLFSFKGKKVVSARYF